MKERIVAVLGALEMFPNNFLIIFNLLKSGYKNYFYLSISWGLIFLKQTPFVRRTVTGEPPCENFNR